MRQSAAAGDPEKEAALHRLAEIKARLDRLEQVDPLHAVPPLPEVGEVTP